MVQIGTRGVLVVTAVAVAVFAAAWLVSRSLAGQEERPRATSPGVVELTSSSQRPRVGPAPQVASVPHLKLPKGSGGGDDDRIVATPTPLADPTVHATEDSTGNNSNNRSNNSNNSGFGTETGQ